MRRLLGFIFAMTLLVEGYADEGMRKDMPEPYSDGEGGNYFCIKSGDDLDLIVRGGFHAPDAELHRPESDKSNLGRRRAKDIKSISGINGKCFKLTYRDDSFEYVDLNESGKYGWDKPYFVYKKSQYSPLVDWINEYVLTLRVVEVGQDWIQFHRRSMRYAIDGKSGNIIEEAQW